MRPIPAASVAKWLETQRRASVFSTTITQAEILYGIDLLPEGKRRDGLLGAAMTLFNVRLAGKVLSFDSDAAVISRGWPPTVAGAAGRSVTQMRRSPRSR